MANKAKRKKKPAPEITRDDVTPERAAKNDFTSAGMARRLKPVIDSLRDKGDLTIAEWEALAYYRDQASLADKSPVRSCCDFSPRGGYGPGVAILSSSKETERLDRNLGSFRHMVRAIAVGDVRVVDWCAAKFGTAAMQEDEGARGVELKAMVLAELKSAASLILPHR